MADRLIGDLLLAALNDEPLTRSELRRVRPVLGAIVGALFLCALAALGAMIWWLA